MSAISRSPSRSIFVAPSFLVATTGFFSFFFLRSIFSSLNLNIFSKFSAGADSLLSLALGAGCSSFFFFTMTRPRLFCRLTSAKLSFGWTGSVATGWASGSSLGAAWIFGSGAFSTGFWVTVFCSFSDFSLFFVSTFSFGKGFSSFAALVFLASLGLLSFSSLLSLASAFLAVGFFFSGFFLRASGISPVWM